MIIDQLKNAMAYFGVSKRIAAGLQYLQNTDLSKTEPGTYDIDGKDVYSSVQQYETKPKEEGRWEAHRRYIDIQYVARGIELMGYENLENLKAGKYDDTRDVVFLEGEGNFLKVHAGTFVILMPQDAHMPQIAVTVPRAVRKIVVKVHV